jgi:hypothetical protein
MDLKNAVAVCLISLFSATLVLLIARALDIQAADRLEPQLARIVEQLEAIRAQGGVAGPPGTGPERDELGDGLVVYYFHGDTRCATCQAIEAQSHAAVQEHYSAELQDGTVSWEILNYEGAAAEFAEQFAIQVPVVVLARIEEGQIGDWKRLDKVWALVGDEEAFGEFIRSEISRMLSADERAATGALEESDLEIPLPDAPPEIPIPE